jgi:hypothetical protein
MKNKILYITYNLDKYKNKIFGQVNSFVNFGFEVDILNINYDGNISVYNSNHQLLKSIQVHSSKKIKNKDLMFLLNYKKIQKKF